MEVQNAKLFIIENQTALKLFQGSQRTMQQQMLQNATDDVGVLQIKVGVLGNNELAVTDEI